MQKSKYDWNFGDEVETLCNKEKRMGKNPLSQPSFASSPQTATNAIFFFQFRENSLKEMSKMQHFDEGISIFLAQKTRILRTWVHFCFIRRSSWTEGGGLQISWTLWAAIDAIKTWVSELRIGVNFKGVV